MGDVLVPPPQDLESILGELRSTQPVRYTFVAESTGHILASYGARPTSKDVRPMGGVEEGGIPRWFQDDSRTLFVPIDRDHILGVVAERELRDDGLRPTLEELRAVLGRR